MAKIIPVNLHKSSEISLPIKAIIYMIDSPELFILRKLHQTTTDDDEAMHVRLLFILRKLHQTTTFKFNVLLKGHLTILHYWAFF